MNLWWLEISVSTFSAYVTTLFFLMKHKVVYHLILFLAAVSFQLPLWFPSSLFYFSTFLVQRMFLTLLFLCLQSLCFFQFPPSQQSNAAHVKKLQFFSVCPIHFHRSFPYGWSRNLFWTKTERIYYTRICGMNDRVSRE